MRTIDELKAILTSAQYWEYLNGGIDAVLESGLRIRLSDEEFDALDEKLVPYLDRLVTMSSKRTVNGDDVEMTVRYWRDECDYLEDKEGKIHILQSLYTIDDEGSETVIYGDFLNISYFWSMVKNRVHEIPFVAPSSASVFCAETRWLNDNYPDWRERWETVLALNLDADERQAYVFTKAPLVSQDKGVLPDDLSMVTSTSPD